MSTGARPRAAEHASRGRRAMVAGRALCLSLASILTLVPMAAVEADFGAGQRALEERYYVGAPAEWTRPARDGNSAAQIGLGIPYENSFGLPVDDARAAAWYRLAAEQDDPGGQYELGMKYLKGMGVQRNPAKAVKWIRAAAEQGLPEAQYRLGLLSRRGVGVKPDAAEAAKWHRRAAEQGFALAMARLGSIYFEGVGVDEDPLEAFVWFSLALEGGIAAVRGYKKAAEKRLSPEQLARAQAMVAERKARIEAAK